MRFIKIIALTLAAALLLGGCSLVRVDEEKVANQVVAKVNDTEIYKYEISETEVYSYVNDMISYGQQLGMGYNQEEIDELIVSQRESMLEARVTAEVLMQKAAELGITLTEEEKAENLVDAQDSLDSMMDYFISQTEAEFEELTAAIEGEGTDSEETADAEENAEEEPTDPAVLAAAQIRYDEYVKSAGISLESLHKENNEQDIMTKVREYTKGFAQVTDEDVRSWYDQTLALQQEEMNAEAGSFEDLVQTDKIYTYVPEGVVAVRDVVIAFDDEISGGLKAAYDEEQTDQYDALMNAALSEFSEYIATAVGIKDRIDGGEQIEDIIEELSAEMDNISETSSQDGIVVDKRSTQFTDTFLNAAVNLENVGDVSEPFADYEGVHVLVLVKKFEPGVVPFDELADSIKTALQPGAEDDKYNEMLEAWKEEADIKYYYDRLNSNNDF